MWDLLSANHFVFSSSPMINLVAISQTSVLPSSSAGNFLAMLVKSCTLVCPTALNYCISREVLQPEEEACDMLVKCFANELILPSHSEKFSVMRLIFQQTRIPV
jgi:hypothetical protein